MNKGFSKLADESEDFDSKTILGLLRDAPDLLPNIKNVQSMYQPTEEKGMRFAPS
jgi:DNA mismatch repair protein MSH6